MGFSIGIIGLPNAGKSTLFKALTKQKVGIAPYAFTTREPNLGLVPVPDERLEKIAEVLNVPQAIPATVKFTDIAGLVKNAHKGEGLGNQFLSHIRNCTVLVEVVRGFEAPDIEHTEGSVDPGRDIEIIKTELLMKDLETAEELLLKGEKDVKTGDKKMIKKQGLLKKMKEAVAQGKPSTELGLNEEEVAELKEFQFLTAKPIIYLLNVGEENRATSPALSNLSSLTLNLKLEEEISEFLPAEREELGVKGEIERLILECYRILDLITFYTVRGLKEVRAWALKRGIKAPQAGGCVHSDFETKFVRAEVIPWQKLLDAQSWTKARELGWLRTEGKDYIVQDDDVIEFKI